MKPVVYLGCPPQERLETEKALGAADVSVVWADSVPLALAELQRRDVPSCSISRAARPRCKARATSDRSARRDADVRRRRLRRPDLTTEAVLAGMADVFARPLGGRRVANAIERELSTRHASVG